MYARGDHWGTHEDRTTNRTAGCSCPPQRYDPTTRKTTNPTCAAHGTTPEEHHDRDPHLPPPR